MDAYIYQAALYCEDCADGIKSRLSTMQGCAKNVEHEADYDSDDWPKGPYADGGGEADTPQHCDECHCFLENPLTDEGLSYVYESLAEYIAGGTADWLVLSTWAAFYEVTIDALLGAVALARLRDAGAGLRIDPRTGRTEAGA